MPTQRVKWVVVYATPSDEAAARVVEAYHLRDVASPTDLVNAVETVDGFPVRVREVVLGNAADANQVYQRARQVLQTPNALPPGVLPVGMIPQRVRGTVASYLCSHSDPTVVSCRDHPSSAFAETVA